MEDLRDEARPARTTATILGWLRFDLGLSRLLHGAISAHAIGIYPSRFSSAWVSSADIGSATCAEKPGCLQAMSFVASSCEMACFRASRARSRSRKSRISASPSQVARGWNVPSSENAPSVERTCRCTCHWRRSPAVAIETTTRPAPIEALRLTPGAPPGTNGARTRTMASRKSSDRSPRGLQSSRARRRARAASSAP